MREPNPAQDSGRRARYPSKRHEHQHHLKCVWTPEKNWIEICPAKTNDENPERSNQLLTANESSDLIRYSQPSVYIRNGEIRTDLALKISSPPGRAEGVKRTDHNGPGQRRARVDLLADLEGGWQQAGQRSRRDVGESPPCAGEKLSIRFARQSTQVGDENGADDAATNAGLRADALPLRAMP